MVGFIKSRELGVLHDNELLQNEKHMHTEWKYKWSVIVLKAL